MSMWRQYDVILAPNVRWENTKKADDKIYVYYISKNILCKVEAII